MSLCVVECVLTCVCLFCLLLQPLNPHPDSKWSQYFTDNEMLVQIDKDCRYFVVAFVQFCCLLFSPVLDTGG